ncbi:MAG TPA: hypothetical protein PLG21_03665 [Anaerolineae bacterium]|nr:hypothetical protein [Anaerolineae bacterium]
MLRLAREKVSRIARLAVGSLLLLPAVLGFGLALGYPALRTLALSLQTAVLGRPGQWADLANYARLAADPVLGAALGHSLLVIAARLAGLALPALAGWLLSRAHPAARLAAGLALGLPLALSAPAAWALLWPLAAKRVPWLQALAFGTGSRALCVYLGLEALAFLGLGGALTAAALLVARGRRARMGVLGLAALLTAASGLASFTLPFVATGGGPNGATLTPPLLAFRTAFQARQLGPAAAQATLLLAASLGLGLAFGLVSERLGLRLVAAGATAAVFPSPSQGSAADRATTTPSPSEGEGRGEGAPARARPEPDRATTTPSPSEGEGRGEGETSHRRPTGDSSEPLPARPKARHAVASPLTLALSPLAAAAAARGEREQVRLSAPEPRAHERGSHVMVALRSLLPSPRARGRGAGGEGTSPLPGGILHRSLARLAVVLALALIILPFLLAYLWCSGLACHPSGAPLAQAAAELLPGLSLLNGTLAPLLATLGVGLPSAYLAALSLSLVQPFGRRGSRAASLALLALGFVPPVAVATGLFEAVRAGSLYDSPLTPALPYLACPAAFYILTLYFDGIAPLLDKARLAGQPAAGAFLQLAFRPSLGIAALGGAMSLLFQGQSLLWPLLVLAQRDYLPLSLRLAVLQNALAQQPAVLGAGCWLVLTAWGIAILLAWLPLQALVLPRLELASQQSGCWGDT